MSSGWHHEQTELFEKTKDLVARRYPELDIVIEDDTVFLRGTFQILDKDSQIIDQYEIELKFPKDYPKRIPTVRELGNKIPRKTSRHIDPDGSCCVCVHDIFLSQHPDGYDIVDFLEGPVKSFFISQSYYEENGEWLYGEWSHGPQGIFESYKELLDLESAEKVIDYLQVLKMQNLKGHIKCPCGSNAKVRDCHFDELEKLREKIPWKVAKRRYKYLLEKSDLLDF